MKTLLIIPHLSAEYKLRSRYIRGVRPSFEHERHPEPEEAFYVHLPLLNEILAYAVIRFN